VLTFTLLLGIINNRSMTVSGHMPFPLSHKPQVSDIETVLAECINYRSINLHVVTVLDVPITGKLQCHGVK